MIARLCAELIDVHRRVLIEPALRTMKCLAEPFDTVAVAKLAIAAGHDTNRNFFVAIEQIKIVRATITQRRLRVRNRRVIERMDARLLDLDMHAAGARDAGERHKRDEQTPRTPKRADNERTITTLNQPKDRKYREFSGFGQSRRMLRKAPIKGNRPDSLRRRDVRMRRLCAKHRLPSS